MSEESKFIPDSKKDKAWHKKFHDKYLRSSDARPDMLYRSTTMLEWYLGRIKPEEVYNADLTAANGMISIVQPIHVNKIRDKIEFMVGDYTSRPVTQKVNAISPEAVSRKKFGISRIESQYEMLPFYARLQERDGVPLISEDMPLTPEDLEEQVENYKEQGEEIYGRLLDDHDSRSAMAALQTMLLEDANVFGLAGVYIHSDRGWPEVERLYADELIVDGSARDSHFKDAKFVAIARYMSVEDIGSQFDLGEEERDTLKKLEKGRAMDDMREMAIGTNSHTFPLFRRENGSEEILVTKVFFYDLEPMRKVRSMDTYGKEHIQYEDARKRMRGNSKEVVEEFNIQCVRYCTVIANSVVPENGYGKLNYQYRDKGHDWVKTQFPVISFAPYWRSGRFTSTVEQMIDLQKRIDMCYMKIDQAMRNDRGKFIPQDTAQTPDGWKSIDVLPIAEQHGSFFFSSMRMGVNSPYNQFSAIDLSLSPSVNMYLAMINSFEDQMQRMVNLPDTRMGFAEQQYQKAGVAQQSLRQSTISSQFLYRQFDLFIQRIKEYVLDRFRILIGQDPSEFEHIIGSDGLQFLKEHGAVDLEDYGIEVRSDGLDAARLSTISTLAQQYAANNMVPPDELLNLILEENPRTAKHRLGKSFREAKRKQAAMDQQQMQMQMQMQQMQQQADEQKRNLEMERLMLERYKIDGQLSTEDIKVAQKRDQVSERGQQELQRAKMQIEAQARQKEMEAANKRYMQAEELQAEQDMLQRKIRNQRQADT